MHTIPLTTKSHLELCASSALSCCSWAVCLRTSITKQHALYMMWIKVVQSLILHTWVWFSGVSEFIENPHLFAWENATVLNSSRVSCAASLADWNLALASLADRDVISFTSLRLNFSPHLLINILTFLVARLFSSRSHFHIQLFCCIHAHAHRPK